MQMLTIG